MCSTGNIHHTGGWCSSRTGVFSCTGFGWNTLPPMWLPIGGQCTMALSQFCSSASTQGPSKVRGSGLDDAYRLMHNLHTALFIVTSLFVPSGTYIEAAAASALSGFPWVRDSGRTRPGDPSPCTTHVRVPSGCRPSSSSPCRQPGDTLCTRPYSSWHPNVRRTTIVHQVFLSGDRFPGILDLHSRSMTTCSSWKEHQLGAYG
jgi:hypothetical protein